MTGLFREAVGIVRAHEANRRHDAATQRCLDSFSKVRAHSSRYPQERTQAAVDSEALALFDATEARAINSGYGGF